MAQHSPNERMIRPSLFILIYTSFTRLRLHWFRGVSHDLPWCRWVKNQAQKPCGRFCALLHSLMLLRQCNGSGDLLQIPSGDASIIWGIPNKHTAGGIGSYAAPPTVPSSGARERNGSLKWYILELCSAVHRAGAVQRISWTLKVRVGSSLYLCHHPCLIMRLFGQISQQELMQPQANENTVD